MPLIDTSIADILADVGVTAPRDANGKTDMQTLRERNGLGDEAILSVLGSIMHSGSSEAIKLQAVDKALRVAGIGQDKQAVMPTVIINIREPGGGVSIVQGSVNPILVPRELL